MSKYKIYDEDGKVEGYLNTNSTIFLSADDTLGMDHCTRNTILYMTPRSKRYFLLHQSMWQGEGNSVEEINRTQAIEFVRYNCDADESEKKLKLLGAEPIIDIE